ncbi:MAG: hypothetical protein WCP62_17435, partial [Planctomycetota bacterium]
MAPLRIGIPFAKGTDIQQLDDLRICSEREPLAQSVLTPTGKWDDGSIRWAYIEVLANLSETQTLRLLPKGQVSRKSTDSVALPIAKLIDRSLQFQIQGVQKNQVFSSMVAVLEVTGAWGTATLTFDPTSKPSGKADELGFQFESLSKFKSENLPLPIEFGLSGKFWCTGQIDLAISVRNPNPADHPGGNWDLGNQGSFYIQDLTLKLVLQGDASRSELVVRESCDGELKTAKESIELFQASSGGQNWNSSNHIDRNRKIPLPFRGYRLCVDGARSTAERSTPYVAIESDGTTLAVACNRFWQNFPMAIRANGKTIDVGLLPKESGYEH